MIPYDLLLLRAALFYPTRKDIVETDKQCAQLAVVAATSEEEKIYPISSDTMSIWIDMSQSQPRHDVEKYDTSNR